VRAFAEVLAVVQDLVVGTAQLGGDVLVQPVVEGVELVSGKLSTTGF
jgi:hypothetical protein